MTTGKGVVVPAGGGQHLEESSGQVMSMKLFGRQTGQSVTLFEQAVPAGSKKLDGGPLEALTDNKGPEEHDYKGEFYPVDRHINKKK